MRDTRQINRAKLPSFWGGMSFIAKAAFLCAQGQARSFNEAASMLAKCGRTKRTPSVVVDKKYWWVE